MCCRVCLDEGKTFLSLQTEVEFDGKKVTCMEMYCSVTGIEDINENNISMKVCLSCFTELNKCFKFQKKAIQSFYNLLSALESRDANTQDASSEINKVAYKIESLSDTNLDLVSLEENASKAVVSKTEIELVDNETQLETLNECTNVYDEEYLEAEFIHDKIATKDADTNTENSEYENNISPKSENTPVEANSKQHKCTICCMFLPSQADLDTHFVVEHSESIGGQLVCSVCNKRFGSKKTLRQHCRIHQDRNLRRFRCQYCSKAFNYSHHLKIHETIHTMEKPFSCSSCDKRFACKDRLRNHEVQHTDLFKYHCSVTACLSSFRSKKSLKMHTILKHDAVVGKFDPILCSKCNKKLYSQSAASVHFKGPCGNNPLEKANVAALDEV
ncbi:zinc finger protein 490-like [Sabethes cyaneus]|uniref:zinc finger protein 490-like n=1 Tax=Sabethes cyaneus TaxID=53552 RepID=UPI00237E02F4|nr:zinc finger protein 490-like [Sabethes cyaneus]